MPLPRTRRSAIGERLRNLTGAALDPYGTPEVHVDVCAVDPEDDVVDAAGPTDLRRDARARPRRRARRPARASARPEPRRTRAPPAARRPRCDRTLVSTARALRSPSAAAIATASQRLRQHPGRDALVVAQVRVPARHRDTIGLAHERAARARRPEGRGPAPSAGSPRAAGSPCDRRTRSTGRRSRTAS